MFKKVLILLAFSGFIFGQNFNGVKIYINPGHGGHDPSNDRYIPQTGFWESEGNLTKGLRLRDYLVSMGANVKMSRTQNRDADDLSLSVIDADANNFDADYFHSIHSNAYNGTSNYTIVFYKETNGQPVFAKAKQMAQIMSPQIYATDRTTKYRVSGDYSFLGFHLGVLRTLDMPGTLSEGSFHDYIPESWRLMNLDYRKHEALAIARSFLDYYNLGRRSLGTLAGILRDPTEKVNYYAISGTNDGKRPVNNFKVTLNPGNKVYFGDDKNNGFYLFDSLTAGTYTAIVEAEDFKPDTFQVNVTNGRTVFYDRFLEMVPNYDPPYVVSFLPDTNSVVSLKPEIKIEFSVRMNTGSVLSALRVDPLFNGTTAWENNDKTLILQPANNLQVGTTYTIRVLKDAESFFGVKMQNDFVVHFTTRSELHLVKVYPPDGSKDISRTVLIVIKFDGQIDPNSLTGRVRFVNAEGNDVPIFVNPSEYDEGKIIFEPSNPLSYNANYQIILSEGIRDSEGLTFQENRTITFRTEMVRYVSGNVIDPMEERGQWWDPDISGSTTGTDPNQTKFEISTARKVNGNSSGKITYVFTGDEGVCREFDPAVPSIGSNSDDFFGMWIYGDLSGNLLEYWFYDSQRNNATVFVDTINWSGWKLKTVSLGDIPISGEKYFHSVVIKKIKSGNKTGAIYFDDIQNQVVTGFKNVKNELPTSFELLQNYPNPFGKAISSNVTTIGFSLPRNSNVKLTVFNVLGQRVKTLIAGKDFSTGVYSVKWDGKNNKGVVCPSGVYFYRIYLRAGNREFSDVKKMIIIR